MVCLGVFEFLTTQSWWHTLKGQAGRGGWGMFKDQSRVGYIQRIRFAGMHLENRVGGVSLNNRKSELVGYWFDKTALA